VKLAQRGEKRCGASTGRSTTFVLFDAAGWVHAERGERHDDARNRVPARRGRSSSRRAADSVFAMNKPARSIGGRIRSPMPDASRAFARARHWLSAFWILVLLVGGPSASAASAHAVPGAIATAGSPQVAGARALGDAAAPLLSARIGAERAASASSSFGSVLVSSTPVIGDGIASIDLSQYPHVFRMSDASEIAIYSDTNLGLAYAIKTGIGWGSPHALAGPADQRHSAWTRDGDTLYGLTGPEFCSGPTEIHKLVYAAGTVTDTMAQVAVSTFCTSLEYGIYFDHANNLVHIWYEQQTTPSEQLAAYDTALARKYAATVAPTSVGCGDYATAVGGDGGALFFLFSVPACDQGIKSPELQRVVAGASAYTVTQETGVATGASHFFNAAMVWDGAHVLLVAKQDNAGIYVNTRTGPDAYSGWQNVAGPPDPIGGSFFTRITASVVGAVPYIGYSAYQTSTSGPDAGDASRQHRVLYYVSRVDGTWNPPTFLQGLDSNDYDPASGATTDLNDLGTWRFVYHVQGQCTSFSCGYGPFLYEGFVSSSDFGSDFGASAPWTFGDFSGNALSPDPVNLGTGSFTAHATDLSLPGRTLPLAFTRSYNSADTTSGPLGPAWTHSYNWKLTDTGSSVTVRRGDGRRDTYTRNADGTYALPADMFDPLVKNADGTFTLTLTSQVQYEFSAAGALTRIHEPAGNQIILAYTGANLTTITDAVGRTLTLSYDGANHLTQLQDPLGRKVTYAYDANGRLATITDKLGNTAARPRPSTSGPTRTTARPSTSPRSPTRTAGCG